MKNKRADIKGKCKDMTTEEKEKYKSSLIKNKKEEQENFKLERKLKKDKEKEEFKKLTKDEKAKLKENKKQNIKEKYIEFPYLEELNDAQYNELKSNNWVVSDPGKRCLFYFKNKEGKTLRYTNKKHMKKTKRLKYQRLIKNYRDKKGITKIEQQLSTYNSKSCVYDEYKKYIRNKNKLNEELLDKYKEDIYRKYKWYSYINRKRTETDLVREIKETYTKDSILIIGDWSDKLKTTPSRIKYISTPNLGLKRKLNEYFKVYNIDEFRTSCLNYKTEEKGENLYLPDKKKVMRKIHSVLTYQTESKRMGCINRDENAVNNMVKLVKIYIDKKERPEKYRREYKFTDEKKDDNLGNIITDVKCSSSS